MWKSLTSICLGTLSKRWGNGISLSFDLKWPVFLPAIYILTGSLGRDLLGCWIIKLKSGRDVRLGRLWFFGTENMLERCRKGSFISATVLRCLNRPSVAGSERTPRAKGLRWEGMSLHNQHFSSSHHSSDLSLGERRDPWEWGLCLCSVLHSH